MKKTNYIITVVCITIITGYCFINVNDTITLSNNILQLVINNLLPTLLPFMILLSLCVSLGIIHILGYFIQFLFIPLFKLSPTMSTIYFFSFFCGYPTIYKIIHDTYQNKLLNVAQVQRLLTMCNIASPIFFFITISLPYGFLIYICHILPSIIYSLSYNNKPHYQSINETVQLVKNSHKNLNCALKNSFISSMQAFLFITGYLIVFQCISSFLFQIINNIMLTSFLNGILEFSSGAIALSKIPMTPLIYGLISFILSFTSCSILMQMDTFLDGIPCNFKKIIMSRLLFACSSFTLAYLSTAYFMQ